MKPKSNKKGDSKANVRNGAPVDEMESQESMQHQLIERRAYELFLQRGGQSGQDLEDWFEAERQIKDISPRRARMTPVDP